MDTYSSILRLGVLLIAFTHLPACARLVYDPAPVVPVKQPLPYSATVTLPQVGAYFVKPGATMIADPSLANHVIGASEAVESAQRQWEQAVLRYLEERKTFLKVGTKGPSDVEIALHVNVYIDAGLSFQFRHVYVARADAAVIDPRTRLVLLSYGGYGKAAGDVRRDGRADDQEPINRAVQMALHDLFGKMEQDGRMRRL